jgi:CheY-like chemotaxis protein
LFVPFTFENSKWNATGDVVAAFASWHPSDALVAPEHPSRNAGVIRASVVCTPRRNPRRFPVSEADEYHFVEFSIQPKSFSIGSPTLFGRYVLEVPEFPDSHAPMMTLRSASFPGNIQGMRDKKVILLVEDERALRTMAKTALVRSGEFAVIEAEEVEDALSAWEMHEGQIDLLITDVTLRDGGNGGELARQLRERDASLPIMIASGNDAESYGAAIAKWGGCVALPKPYNLADLIRLARELTSR